MSEKPNHYGKPDLVNAIVAGGTMTKAQAEAIVDVIAKAIKQAVRAGKKVSIREFLTIEAKDVAERQGRNPRTGDPITIPAHKRVVAKAKFEAQ